MFNSHVPMSRSHCNVPSPVFATSRRDCSLTTVKQVINTFGTHCIHACLCVCVCWTTVHTISVAPSHAMTMMSSTSTCQNHNTPDTHGFPLSPSSICVLRSRQPDSHWISFPMILLGVPRSGLLARKRTMIWKFHPRCHRYRLFSKLNSLG